MIKKLLISLFFFLFLSFTPQKIVAQSDYVLPYPSSMPGSKLYKLHQFYEKIEAYWYFGDFGGFKYNLKQADKYLVEAKTLFEYKQYLLAFNALSKSDSYFKNIKQNLEKANLKNKNIIQKENLLKNAGLKHIEVLSSILVTTPNNFVWNPEKSSPINLDIRKTIEESIRIRNLNN